ncbi:sigma-E factor negative regulatory protein [Ramlibacter sp.]|uniref:sigma-E factor negative regulatory protein n=1 Tax=Ramlibacter sp. TaxID=1917967 RepID=UPI002619DD9F|nr:sigma-E factor negative regulatory protein [Ramlibacter sp.]
MDKMDKHEMISALADGQLRGADMALGVTAAAATVDGRASWDAYQVIGEVLRSGHAPVGRSSPEAFLVRLQVRLAQEAAVPRSMPAVPAIVVRPPRAQAANEGRWKLVAGFASVAAVAAVGWNMFGAVAPAGSPQLAAAPSSVLPVAAQRTPLMIRDPRLDQLLQAHRQLGGATALQTPSGFLRNATFEGPAR